MYCVLSERGLYMGLITRPEESYLMYCVLSDRGLYMGLITRPEESYLMYCVVRQRSLCGADHSSRGVLPNVLCCQTEVSMWG